MSSTSNAITWHPTLRVPHPNLNIILTCPWYTDAPPSIAAFNLPAVYTVLVGPPYPYTLSSFEEFFHGIQQPLVEAAALEFFEVILSRERGDPEKKWVGIGNAFQTIRAVNPETGEETFLGQIEIRRKTYVSQVVGGESESRRLTEINNNRKAGDEEIEWELGCEFLFPSLFLLFFFFFFFVFVFVFQLEMEILMMFLGPLFFFFFFFDSSRSPWNKQSAMRGR